MKITETLRTALVQRGDMVSVRGRWYIDLDLVDMTTTELKGALDKRVAAEQPSVEVTADEQPSELAGAAGLGGDSQKSG